MSGRQAALPAAGLSLQVLAEQLSFCDAQLVGDGSVIATDLYQDSRQVTPRSIFVARSGERVDGLAFIEEAVSNGAVALLVKAAVAREVREAFPTLPVIGVNDLRQALSFAAEAIHHWPSQALCVVGITGTNGKTTLTWLVAHLLESLGVGCGQIGTLGTAFAGSRKGGSLTTPQADELSRSLSAMRTAGLTHVVMEVSSVALVQRRVEFIRFDVAAFTNFTRDHLDFHGSLENYWNAKASLFTSLNPRVSVLNVDDAKLQSLAARIEGEVLRVGRVLGADIDVTRLHCSQDGIEGEVLEGGQLRTLSSPLLGEHNVENLSVALGVVSALGFDLGQAMRQFSELTAPPGRLERCDELGDDCTVLVDYAHTPDALVAVLDALRALTSGKLICVFGCGGDRDPGKRQLMGKVVAERADMVVLTNDNPRGERAEAISAMVEQGIQSISPPVSYCIELDRAIAIELAVVQARAGDIVLLAGKGHETYQEVCGERFDFDDREQARAALKVRRLLLLSGARA